ncbi:MAG: yqkF [Chloroflexi bacterium]|nr:yqkF [Chloroflexota bacterium]
MMDLPKRQLGRTDMQVTALGYGGMELRGDRGRDISDEEAGRILNAVLDAGVNYIDTSIDYGLSEERIGKHISHRRDEFFLASKCGCLVGADVSAMTGRGFPHVFTPENIIAGVDQSLRRLKTDHLDLVQFHTNPSKAQLEEHGGLSALKDLQKQGKVRFIGMSGTLPNLPEQIDMGAFDVFQVPYSALQRDHEDLMTRAAETGAGIVVRGGAARGGPSKHEGNFWDAWQKMEIDDLLDGMSPMEFIVRFTISHPAMSTTIVGTLNTDHLRDNANAVAKGPLPAELYAEAKRRLTAAGSVPAA